MRAKHGQRINARENCPWNEKSMGASPGRIWFYTGRTRGYTASGQRESVREFSNHWQIIDVKEAVARRIHALCLERNIAINALANQCGVHPPRL